MRDRVFRLNENVITPGKMIKCPVCNEFLNNSEAGIRSHLRRHVKNKEIKKNVVLKFMLSIRKDKET